MELTSEQPTIDETYQVSAGKLRRYHGESWLRRVSDFRTNALNIRDAFRVTSGVVEAWRLLGRVKPDVVFLKGGFVGVPIGLAAAVRHIPIVTHDSDALPGLANRLVSRWAKVHATALPAEYYDYPAAKVRPVGVLVEHNYQPVSSVQKQAFKLELDIQAESHVLLVTGGSSGAERINRTVSAIASELLQAYPTLQIVHQVGKGKAFIYGGQQHERLQILEFLMPMHVYMGAADLVIARASANTIAELGIQGKACIVIPHPGLSGGHQLKNAERLKEQGAALVVEEASLDDPQTGLLAATKRLLNDADLRMVMSKKLQKITVVNAANLVAGLLLEQASKEQGLSI